VECTFQKYPHPYTKLFWGNFSYGTEGYWFEPPTPPIWNFQFSFILSLINCDFSDLLTRCGYFLEGQNAVL